MTEWISVKDRLPELGIPVAILLDGNYMLPDIAYRSSKIRGNPWCSRYAVRVDSVTHWMPLPEPPKEEEQ